MYVTTVIMLYHSQNPVFATTIHPPPQGNQREARLSGFMGCDFVWVMKVNAVPQHQWWFPMNNSAQRCVIAQLFWLPLSPCRTLPLQVLCAHVQDRSTLCEISWQSKIWCFDCLVYFKGQVPAIFASNDKVYWEFCSLLNDRHQVDR